MIEIIGTTLNQWDTGRSVQVTDIEADHVHFANKGDSKAVIMEIADSQAKIPDYLLQTGKQVCVYAVKNGVTVESKTFYVQKRERPENYVYEDDQRNYIYELISKAEASIEGAHSAYQDATVAVEAANTAVVNANVAVENANRSADSASIAAKSANEAADKANHTAKSLMVVGSAEGDSIHLDDAIDQFLVGLRIFGKTTQDGTPTPEAPVELESVENPAVTVNDQTLFVPYTLHGIPVATGGNYTDANGQQWICDEIDFARGVYVQRIVHFSFAVVDMNGSENYPSWTNAGIAKHYPDASNAIGRYGASAMCNIEAKPNDNVHINTKDGKDVLMIPNPKGMKQSEWKTNYPDLVYELIVSIPTAIETALSAEDLAAFAALRTSRGSTTVSNDASAHMEIEYVMDAKKYIDSMLSSATRITSVSLPASKWTGGGSLYSQVVSIEGITENSQVNLAPSVEQMATFYEKDVTFVTENDGGVVTVYVIGQKPQNDYTIQADIVEVSE